MSSESKAVFLSYASQDAEAAKRICDALRAAGVEVWFDQNELVGGDAWDLKIRRQIKECALLIPIISAATQARTEGYFRLEWRLADQRTHLMAKGRPFLLPVVIDDTRDADAHVPDSFLEVQWTRLRQGHGGQGLDDAGVAAFVARVKKLLSGEEGARAPRPVISEPTDPESRSRAAKSKPTVLWILLALVVAVPAYCIFRPRRSPEEVAQLLAQAQALADKAEKSAANPAPNLPPVAAPKPAEANPAGKTGPGPAPAVPAPGEEKSVAVLAFANLSDDKGNEYFSDGVSEELLTVLQKIPGLHVAARTSSFSFKGKAATAQEIGTKLGVANLVEGSVQKSGPRVKVTARLSRAATGEELWSRSYTRELKDVFALQEELALAIVGELRGQLAGGRDAAAVKAAVRGGTTNPEAYQWYLQGRFHVARDSEKSMGEALAAFQKAVELDPDFALAWADVGLVHMWDSGFSTEIGQDGFKAHLAGARQATDRALALAPKLPEALLVRALIQLNFDFDWKGAGETLRTALAVAPADPSLLTAAGNLAGAAGDRERAIELYRQAVALDPVNPLARSFLAFDLVMAGKYPEAQAEYARVVELNPAAPWAHAGLGLSFVRQGKFEEAVSAAQDDAAEWARLLVTALARFGQKRRSEADAALAQLTAKFGDTAAYQIAEVHAYRGERDEAFAWLDRAFRQRDSGLIELRHDPLMLNLKDDPRWHEFLRKLNLAPEP